MILLIGMAVGVDYSLFYLRREREERAKGRHHLDAVEIAAETSGHAVVVSGIAVIISMAGLFLAGDAVFSSLAVGSILVVAVAVLGSLTVLPALLAKLGRWVDRPRVPLLWRLTARRIGPDGQPAAARFWPAVLRPALRIPVGHPARLGRAAARAGGTGAEHEAAVPGHARTCRAPPPACRPTTGSSRRYPSNGTTHTVAVRAPAERPMRSRRR